MPRLARALAVTLALAVSATVAAPAGAQTAPAPTTPAPTAFPLKTAKVNGATLGYRDINPTAAGTPLVLICGYGVTMAEWDPTFVQTLAEGRRVIVFDNRGIGTSSGPVKGLTIAEMARDTAGLMRKLDIKRADVLGWSMGGYIAQTLALARPGMVHRLVLASADPGSPHALQPTKAVVKVLTNPDLTPNSLLPILFPADQQAAGQAWYAAIGTQPNLTAADFATPSATMAAQETANATRWYGRGDGTYARLPKLKAPTWIGYGAQDVVVPPGNARLLARRIPHATAHRFADAGHAFLFQDPAAKASMMAAFLDARAAG
jgi:pimeloyl-ACP methyl ester carboxylesterase